MHLSKLHTLGFGSATNLEASSFDDFTEMSTREMHLPPESGNLDMQYSKAIFDQFLDTYGLELHGE
jgi:hypothetical protein